MTRYTFTPKQGYLITGEDNMDISPTLRFNTRGVIRPKNNYLLKLKVLDSIDPDKDILHPLLTNLARHDESSVHYVTFTAHCDDVCHEGTIEAIVTNKGEVSYEAKNIRLSPNGFPDLRAIRTKWHANITNNPDLQNKKGLSLDEFITIYNDIFDEEVSFYDASSFGSRSNFLESFSIFLNCASKKQQWDVCIQYEGYSTKQTEERDVIRVYTPFLTSRSGKSRVTKDKALMDEMIAHLRMYMDTFVKIQVPKSKIPVMSEEEYAILQARRGTN
ncbi:MAG: hypothetical protein Q8Q42_00425 [Nanoarchaeota archaeon]|nr:hypothetical protein [Nanoarchaeota archaeon]